MATPTRPQAADYQRRQALIAAAGAKAVSSSIRKRAPWSQIASQIGSYQYASALASIRTIASWAGRPSRTDAQAFAGVSSAGFSVLEPVISTIDRVTPAPAEDLPSPWWDDASSFLAEVEQLLATEILDAARTSSQTEILEQGWSKYIRMLNPPSCDRCTILAGRVYDNLDSFARHPGCDCVMVPVDHADAARAEGLIDDPMTAFERGQVTGLSKADQRAIRDGADIGQVVNAKRAGLRAPAGVTNAYVTEVFGRQVKATLHGTTVRSRWRRANPSRLIRLRPESIYQFATDDADARRLLRLYGYIL